MKQNTSIPGIYIKTLSFSTLIIAGVLVIQLFTNSAAPIVPSENERPMTMVIPHEIPADLNFANEPVPVDKADVKESFERELLVNSYWQSQTLLFIKRANRYFPVIEPILKEEGVPDDFKYLALIESSFMPRAISPAGAVGFWQFMKETGKQYGLEVSKEVDERYHLEKSTRAACRYLKNAYARHGSWTLAAASYNAGPQGISKQVDIQKENNYYNLLFGEETGRYVYRILAAKVIITDPAKYGFLVSKDDLYLPFETFEIEVSGPIPDFADFAKSYGVSYKDLKNLNPWLRETFLTNPLKITYKIKLPLSAKKMIEQKI
jgi:hypothetical protein